LLPALFCDGVDHMTPAAKPIADGNLGAMAVAATFQRRQDHRF